MTSSSSSALPGDPLLHLAWACAAEAAAFLRDERPASLAVDTKSSATDAVTVMDRGAESRIVSRILAVRPDDAILGEESGARDGASGVRWVIDPLDGTVNYIYAIPAWAVSVAAADDRGGIVGVVMAPALGLAWVARRDAGAFEVDLAAEIGDLPGGGRRMAVSEVCDLGMALVATGFGYDPARRGRQGAVVAGLLPQVRDIRRIGAATVDQCLVASGRCDAFFERGLHPWDYAAAALIAEESGAVVRGIAGVPLPEGLLVAAPGIADALHGRLVELEAHRA